MDSWIKCKETNFESVKQYQWRELYTLLKQNRIIKYKR